MNKIIIFLKWGDYYLRKITPNFVSGFFTRLASSFIAPIHFSFMTGHFKSSWKKSAVSKNGQPIPWYSYSLIDFLESKDFKNKKVLEIGGGNSSFWWASKAGQVFTFEGNEKWLAHLNEKNTFSNLQIQFVAQENLLPSFQSQLTQLNTQKFDIVILDGMDRVLLSDQIPNLLQDGGMIVVDDSDRYDFSKVFRKHGFSKVDFWGYSPGVIFPKCSSIYFLEDCAMLKL